MLCKRQRTVGAYAPSSYCILYRCLLSDSRSGRPSRNVHSGVAETPPRITDFQVRTASKTPVTPQDAPYLRCLVYLHGRDHRQRRLPAPRLRSRGREVKCTPRKVGLQTAHSRLQSGGDLSAWDARSWPTAHRRETEAVYDRHTSLRGSQLRQLQRKSRLRYMEPDATHIRYPRITPRLSAAYAGSETGVRLQGEQCQT